MTPLSRYVVETLVTLTGVVVAAIVLLGALRRMGVGKPAGPLELVARLPLEGRRSVYLVRAGQTVYVLAASENALTKLGELAESAVERVSEPEPAPFSEVLKRVVGVGRSPLAPPGREAPARPPEPP